MLIAAKTNHVARPKFGGTMGLSVPLINNFWEMAFLSDQSVNWLVKCNGKSGKIPANNPISYLHHTIKIKQWKLNRNWLTNGYLPIGSNRQATSTDVFDYITECSFQHLIFSNNV